MDQLIVLLATVVAIWLIMWILPQLPLTEPTGTVLRILVGLALLIWVVIRFHVLGP